MSRKKDVIKPSDFAALLADFLPQPAAKLPHSQILPQAVAKNAYAEIVQQPVAQSLAGPNTPGNETKTTVSPKVPQPVAQLASDSLLWRVPWGHHVWLLGKVKDLADLAESPS